MRCGAAGPANAPGWSGRKAPFPAGTAPGSWAEQDGGAEGSSAGQAAAQPCFQEEQGGGKGRCPPLLLGTREQGIVLLTLIASRDQKAL